MFSVVLTKCCLNYSLGINLCFKTTKHRLARTWLLRRRRTSQMINDDTSPSTTEVVARVLPTIKSDQLILNCNLLRFGYPQFLNCNLLHLNQLNYSVLPPLVSFWRFLSKPSTHLWDSHYLNILVTSVRVIRYTFVRSLIIYITTS